MKQFGAEDLIAARFNVSGILLRTSTSPDVGAVAHDVLSSSEISPDFVLRQLCNGNCHTVNGVMEDLFQKHPPVLNEPTNAEIPGEQDLKSSNSSCSHPSATYGISKTQLA